MPTSTERIKELREKTGAGVMECKRALDEGGSMDEAEQLLKKWGLDPDNLKEPGLLTVN